MKSAQPFRFNGVVPSRPSASNGIAWRDPRGDQALLFESIQRGIDCAGGNVALKPMLDFLENRATVAFAPKRRLGLQERQEDRLLEGAKMFSHLAYIVDNTQGGCKPFEIRAEAGRSVSLVCSGRLDAKERTFAPCADHWFEKRLP
jgi:hypothetical protein